MIKISLVLMAGLAAASLLRRRSAAVRHWVLAATIACAAMTPVLELVVPSWPLHVSPAWFGRSVEPLTLFVPIAIVETEGPAPGLATPRPTPARRPDIVRALELTWMAGSAVSLSILLIGLARLARLASRSRRIAGGVWPEFTERLARDFGLRRRVVLLQSGHPTLLATWGLWQPKIILPGEARDWPADRVRIVLSHELAHVQRRDWLVQMVAELLRSVYWFNPLTWMVCRRLRQESEQACDDAVLGLGVEGRDYAAHLLEVARAFLQHKVAIFPAPAMARPSSLERRVSAMLNHRLDRAPITRSACIAIVIALICLTIPIAGLVSAAQTTAAGFTGTLVDAVGRILPNVTMKLVNATSGQKREVQSDEAGRFALTDLPAGDYRLEVTLPGFAPSQGRITLTAGQQLKRDVALQIGSLEETLTVWSARGAVAAPATARPPQMPSQPDFDPCSQSQAGGCIKPPLRIADARPRYPQAQSDSGVEGLVEVEGRIGTDGFIKDFRVTAPADPDFVNATLEALRQWQFTATRLDGVPVEANIHIHVKFALE